MADPANRQRSGPAPLKNRLKKAFVKTDFESQTGNFLPAGDLERLITATEIRRKLCPREPDTQFIEYIAQRGKRPFATCLLLKSKDQDLIQAMRMFYDRKPHFGDDDLPVELYVDPAEDTPMGNTNSQGEGYQFNSNDAGDDYLNYDSGDDEREDTSAHTLGSMDDKVWTASKIIDFYELQWHVLGPVFMTSKPYYELELKVILPFIEQSPTEQGGAFSRVFQVKIHPDHFEDPANPNQKHPEYFAVKQLKASTLQEHETQAKNFQHEAQNLHQMNALNNNHIVRFITAFRRGRPGAATEYYYLLFEWANGGCLRDMWKETRQPDLTPDRIKHTIQELLGLSDALCAFHYHTQKGDSFRHGDLKPENILRFEHVKDHKFGRLKIGDWGLAKHHNIETNLRKKNTSTRHGTVL